MSAATDSRNDGGLGAGLGYDEIALSYLGPIAASVNVPKGTIAAKLTADTNTSPVIYPFAISASKTALGVVDVGGDNSSGARGAFPVAVRQRTAKFVDKNAGGGSAIVATDVFKICYAANNQDISKVSSDGEAVGMITGVDADGGPIAGIGPMFLALARAMQLGNVATLTDNSGGAAADGTIAVVTAPSAITDSTTGTPGTTLAAITSPTAVTNSSGGSTSDTIIAAITQAGNAGSADITPTKDAIAKLAVLGNANAAAVILLKNDVASLAARQAENRTAIVALTDAIKELSTKINAIIAA